MVPLSALRWYHLKRYDGTASALWANHEIFRQVGARMIALRMSCCLQKIDLRQDKVKELTQQLYDTINEAAKWYDEFLSE